MERVLTDPATPVTPDPEEIAVSLIYLAPVLDDVSDEADSARAKFGDQFHLTDLEWQSVLLEEVGEAARILTQRDVPPVSTHPQVDGWTDADLRAEVVQIAAVAARWMAAIDDRGPR